MALNLTSEALEGFNTNVPKTQTPYLATSDSWCAWYIGVWLRETGRSAPKLVRPGRGNIYHVNDMKVRFVDPADIERIS